MSNMTHRVSREEDGMELTCEAFNKGTHFSKTQTAKLSVFCEWARVRCSRAAVFLVSKKKDKNTNPQVKLFFKIRLNKDFFWFRMCHL